MRGDARGDPVHGGGALPGRPPRVAFLAGNLYPVLAARADLPIVGGAEVQQVLLARELRALGLEIDFVVEDLGQGARCLVDGFRVHGYAFGRNKLRQARTLWGALCAADPEVIYVRGLPRFLPLVLAYRRLRRRRLVLGLSTNLQVYPRRAAGRSLLAQASLRLALREADAAIAQTRFQEERLRRDLKHPHVRMIRNGATLGPPPPEGARTVAAWIGSLHPHKGIERLFELARRSPSLRFEVAGGPARRHEGYYEAAAAKAQGIPNLRWRGFVPHGEIDQLLGRAFALVNTTLPLGGVANLEGFPNVYLEAWRNGVPTLTLDNDPDELIESKGLGRRCRDLGEMAEELERLARDPAYRERIGAAARLHLEEEHDIRRCAKSCRDLFVEVAARPGAAARRGDAACR